MRLVTVETISFIVVGWVLALGALYVRYYRGEFGRRTGLYWAVVACFSIGWALRQYNTLPETAETVVGTVAPWISTLFGLLGFAITFYLYRTRPNRGDDTADDTPPSEQS
ncbi:MULTISPECIES: hypothetical protein [Haloferax]|uniref:Uncharacterized protein n=2 Tax=Haloferax TaxID=2251 RepID=A0A6G1Z0B8_9EURY|nr:MULTISPECIES: hypothetical protein [Haloferax]KAB1187319.1 hypothetical protein Hfx1149_04470 [Haloferax sp. CBA1149]MRW79966.1 hypothetical protein [Haloferax marinisediminis]